MWEHVGDAALVGSRLLQARARIRCKLTSASVGVADDSSSYAIHVSSSSYDK
jgi:hypothetical protein